MLGIEKPLAVFAFVCVVIQLPRIELKIIFILIIIIEVDIAVGDKTLGDEEIVGLIACKRLGWNNKTREVEDVNRQGYKKEASREPLRV
jgi:hypothetical protein